MVCGVPFRFRIREMEKHDERYIKLLIVYDDGKKEPRYTSYFIHLILICFVTKLCANKAELIRAIFVDGKIMGTKSRTAKRTRDFQPAAY